MASEEVYSEVLRLLLGDRSGELARLFEEIVSREERGWPEGTTLRGWEWYEVHGDPRTLNKLVSRRVLDIVYKSGKSCMYRARDLGAIKKALDDFRRLERPAPEGKVAELPPDFLSGVVGHEDKKEIIRRALSSEEPVHILMWGSPASAKSMILEELSRALGARLILGSALTKAGLYEYLFEERPTYLLIDELDKVDDYANLSALLSLMQTGYVSETKYGRRRELKLKCWVVAAANRVDGLWPELKSRFVMLYFPEYTADEFVEVVTSILPKYEGVPEPLALHIAERCLWALNSRDPRDAIKVARLLRERTKEDVDRVVALLRKQKG